MRLPVNRFDLGVRIGTLARRDLLRRVKLAQKTLRDRKYNRKTMTARVADFKNCLGRVAPEWIREAAGMAKGAGLGLDDILMLNCFPFEYALYGDENCSTAVVIGRERNTLFKIRDHANNPQQFVIVAGKGGLREQIGRDIGNLGAGHYMNGGGLCGANNTGSRIPDVEHPPLLNDCHMLRWIGERAAVVDDVSGLFEELLKNRAVGLASAGRGSILVFMDGEKGGILECDRNGFCIRYVTGGYAAIANHFTDPRAKSFRPLPPTADSGRRFLRLGELLAKNKNALGPEFFFALSRDRKNRPNSLCKDTEKYRSMTVSAQVQVIERGAVASSRNYVCCGNTRNSFFIPVALGERENFAPLVGGDYYRLAQRSFAKHGCSQHLKKVQIEYEKTAGDDFLKNCAAAVRLLRGC